MRRGAALPLHPHELQQRQRCAQRCQRRHRSSSTALIEALVLCCNAPLCATNCVVHMCGAPSEGTPALTRATAARALILMAARQQRACELAVVGRGGRLSWALACPVNFLSFLVICECISPSSFHFPFFIFYLVSPIDTLWVVVLESNIYSRDRAGARPARGSG